MKIESFRRMHFKKGKASKFNQRKKHGKTGEFKEPKPKGPQVQDSRWKEIIA